MIVEGAAGSADGKVAVEEEDVGAIFELVKLLKALQDSLEV